MTLTRWGFSMSGALIAGLLITTCAVVTFLVLRATRWLDSQGKMRLSQEFVGMAMACNALVLMLTAMIGFGPTYANRIDRYEEVCISKGGVVDRAETPMTCRKPDSKIGIKEEEL